MLVINAVIWSPRSGSGLRLTFPDPAVWDFDSFLRGSGSGGRLEFDATPTSVCDLCILFSIPSWGLSGKGLVGVGFPMTIFGVSSSVEFLDSGGLCREGKE